MLKPLYACIVAGNILTRPRMKKAWSSKIGGNDLELARWSSHQPVRNGMCTVLHTRTQTAMFTCGVAPGGDSMPLANYYTCVHFTSQRFLAIFCQGSAILQAIVTDINNSRNLTSICVHFTSQSYGKVTTYKALSIFYYYTPLCGGSKVSCKVTHVCTCMHLARTLFRYL